MVALSGEGDNEQWSVDRPNRLRQRVALKPSLPTIPSGIPYGAERRVAGIFRHAEVFTKLVNVFYFLEYVAAHQVQEPITLVESRRSAGGTACSSGGNTF